jgi:hypothetical protein
MAFGTTPAGTITKQATGITSTRRVGVNNGVNISKGNVLYLQTDGFTTIASNADDGGFAVALEPANNTSGSDGDISVPIAVGGHYVTVIATGAISPGERVIIGATVGKVIAATTTSAESKIVGTYWGKEGGKVVKSTTSADAYKETFTDNADFVPVDAAANDVIEIQLKV